MRDKYIFIHKKLITYPSGCYQNRRSNPIKLPL